MNEPGSGASLKEMHPSQPALPALTAAERALMLAVDDPQYDGLTDGSHADFAGEVQELRLPGERLRALLGGARVDVRDDVMEVIEAGFEQLHFVREALDLEVDLVDSVIDALDTPAVPLRSVLPKAPADLADSIWAGIEDADAMLLSAFGDGELQGTQRGLVSRTALREAGAQSQLQAHARLGAQVREASVHGAPIDLWGAIGAGIGAEGAEPENDVGDELRHAVHALPQIDVAPQVMAAVSPRERSMPRWVALGGPILAMAMAALVLLAVVPKLTLPPSGASRASIAQFAPFQMSAVNDAQVEALETAHDVVAQVVQFDDGGPTFILVDESGALGGTL